MSNPNTLGKVLSMCRELGSPTGKGISIQSGVLCTDAPYVIRKLRKQAKIAPKPPAKG